MSQCQKYYFRPDLETGMIHFAPNCALTVLLVRPDKVMITGYFSCRLDCPLNVNLCRLQLSHSF